MIIILAVLADRGEGSGRQPWGMFTVLATIPIALFMGVYMRFIRPGRIGGDLDHRGVPPARFDLARRAGRGQSGMGAAFHLQWNQITWMLIGYGAVASVLPVWLLLAPRDHLSTFLKIGTIIGLSDRHPDRHAGTEDAGPDRVHRRHRPGLEGQPVPDSCSHHHRLRRDLSGFHAR
ncbi:carbon starvation CstA family protein [Pseudomonas aeruginosa]